MRKLFIALGLLVSLTLSAQTNRWDSLKNEINFFMANDLGRNGYYEQKPIARLMGEMAEAIGPEAVLAAGDVHHFDGIASTQDPLWISNYEAIYDHPELMISWLPILGNHEYRGNTQAVIDYSKVSRRWEMPARYYSKVFNEDGTTVRFVFIDTTPLIDKYRNESDKYADACKQDIDAQLKWLDQTLKEAKENWVIVVGHHPIFAETPKEESERQDMQKRVNTILEKYPVDMYVCGHIHNFQHLKPQGSKIDYVVNSSASLARKVNPIIGTVYCSPKEGFSVFGMNQKELKMYLIDKDGNVLHTITRTK
mgnify:FL=1